MIFDWVSEMMALIGLTLPETFNLFDMGLIINTEQFISSLGILIMVYCIWCVGYHVYAYMFKPDKR